jgi:hypothetical protein
MLREVLYHDRRLLLQGQPRQTFSYFAALGVLGRLWRNSPVCDQHQLMGLLFQQTHKPAIDSEDFQQPVQRGVQGGGQRR